MKKRVLAAVLTLAMCLGLAPSAASADVLTESLPDVSAESYAIIDGDTQQVLFGSNYDEAYDPGSLVQMMTAVIIIEEGNLNDSVTVPEIPEDANTGNRLYLRKGEKVNLSDLLQGIIIYNANDAAIAAANHLAGSESAFVEEMNAKAKELGMSDTTFASCYGSADGQSTTAKDMAILAAYASELPKYVELAIQPTLDWESEMNTDTVSNVNGMQDVDQQAVGLKINTSEPINLTASLSQGSRTIVGAMLNCDSEDAAYTSMQEALDLGLENTTVVDLVTKDEVMTTLNFGDKKSVRVAATKDYAITTSEGNSNNYRSVVVIDKTELPINEGDDVGVLRIYEGDEAIDEVTLVAQDTVKANFNKVWLVVFALVLLYLASFLFLLKGGTKHNGVKLAAARGGGKTPQPRASRPHQSQSGQQAQQKRQPQKKATGTTASGRNARKNPSVGSSSGRQGLEQRLKEQRSKSSSGDDYYRGGRR